MSSVARLTNVGGRVTPSSRAVLRLMTSSCLRTVSIGSSPGLAPLRITKFAVRRVASENPVPKLMRPPASACSLGDKIGIRVFIAASAIRRRWGVVTGVEMTMTACVPPFTEASNTPSKSGVAAPRFNLDDLNLETLGACCGFDCLDHYWRGSRVAQHSNTS